MSSVVEAEAAHQTVALGSVGPWARGSVGPWVRGSVMGGHEIARNVMGGHEIARNSLGGAKMLRKAPFCYLARKPLTMEAEFGHF